MNHLRVDDLLRQIKTISRLGFSASQSTVVSPDMDDLTSAFGMIEDYVEELEKETARGEEKPESGADEEKAA